MFGSVSRICGPAVWPRGRKIFFEKFCGNFWSKKSVQNTVKMSLNEFSAVLGLKTFFEFFSKFSRICRIFRKFAKNSEVCHGCVARPGSRETGVEAGNLARNSRSRLFGRVEGRDQKQSALLGGASSTLDIEILAKNDRIGVKLWQSGPKLAGWAGLGWLGWAGLAGWLPA